MFSALTSFKSLKKFQENSFCVFCLTKLEDAVEYGDICEINGLSTHYFCLIFSENTEQNGLDNEGIMGFLYKDIVKGVQNNRKNICSYCQHPGAAVCCANKSCKKWFHLPCGLDNGSIHEFCDRFKSYCCQHRKPQPIPQSACKLHETLLCLICQEYIRAAPSFKTIWAPCCETVWFHKRCVQQKAMNAGYFFKCPNCNNSEIFRRQIQERGVFIPEIDASWEKTENGRIAFHELTERPNSCQADVCLCPEGRKFSQKQEIYEIKICNSCGSKAAHTHCVREFLNAKEEFTCESCDEIMNVAPWNNKNNRKPFPSVAPVKRLKLDAALLSTRTNKTDRVDVESYSMFANQQFGDAFSKPSTSTSTLISIQSLSDFDISTRNQHSRETRLLKNEPLRTMFQYSNVNSPSVFTKSNELKKICQPSMGSRKIIDSTSNYPRGLDGMQVDVVRFQSSTPLNENVEEADGIDIPTVELLSDSDDSSSEPEKSYNESSKYNHCSKNLTGVISLLDNNEENSDNQEDVLFAESVNIQDTTEDVREAMIETVSKTRFILIDHDSSS